MGTVQSVEKASYEDVKHAINSNYIIITVIPSSESCLIKGTLSPSNEELQINKLYSESKLTIPIVVYGHNDHDTACFKKYKQLREMGFTNVYIYPGGIFEWLLLQDIYSKQHFPTNFQELNVLKFKPPRSLVHKQ